MLPLMSRSAASVLACRVHRLASGLLFLTPQQREDLTAIASLLVAHNEREWLEHEEREREIAARRAA